MPHCFLPAHRPSPLPSLAHASPRFSPPISLPSPPCSRPPTSCCLPYLPLQEDEPRSYLPAEDRVVLEEAGTEEAEIQIKAEALTPDELEEFNGRMAAKALYLSKARTFLALAAPPLSSFLPLPCTFLPSPPFFFPPPTHVLPTSPPLAALSSSLPASIHPCNPVLPLSSLSYQAPSSPLSLAAPRSPFSPSGP